MRQVRSSIDGGEVWNPHGSSKKSILLDSYGGCVSIISPCNHHHHHYHTCLHMSAACCTRLCHLPNSRLSASNGALTYVCKGKVITPCVIASFKLIEHGTWCINRTPHLVNTAPLMRIYRKFLSLSLRAAEFGHDILSSVMHGKGCDFPWIAVRLAI